MKAMIEEGREERLRDEDSAAFHSEEVGECMYAFCEVEQHGANKGVLK
jgi:hypothetical protein